MSEKATSRSGRWASLRQRAERLSVASSADIAEMPVDDVQTLVHELQLYQTELELQNDELRQTEQQLAAARDRYCNLFEYAPVGYVTHDAKGVIREANQTAAALLGVDHRSLIDAALSDFILPEDQDTWYLHRRELVATEDRQTSEIRSRRAVDHTVYLQLESVALHLGEPATEYRTSLIDTTARRQAEMELQRAHDELESRVAARTAGLEAAHERLQEEIVERVKAEQREKQLLAELAHVARVHTMGEMASSLAHELNQPLGAMAAEADAAFHRLGLADEQPTSPVQASLKFISAQALRAGELVRRMRQFARRSTPQKTPLCLSHVIDEAVSLPQKDLQDADIRLLMDVRSELPAVFADKIQIQQVVLNLVRNAIEAIEDASEGSRQISIRAFARSREVEVTVTDTGSGLPTEHAENPEQLFAGFYTTKTDGMGLGLAISRSILEAHGGSLAARRNPDGGAVFSFTLPIIDDPRKYGNEATH